MIFCRYGIGEHSFAGVIRGNLIYRLQGGDSLVRALLGLWEEEVRAVPLESVRLLAPLPDAPNIYCVAANYLDHIRESGLERPEKKRGNPHFFIKPRGSVSGPDDKIALPSISPGAIDWECELAVVIGVGGKHIPVAKASAHIGGVTVFNDYSDRKFREAPNRVDRPWDTFFDWLIGKWHEGFSAMGPVIVTPEEFPRGLSDLAIKLSVNGVLRQNSTTREMIFTPEELISFLSQVVVLQPGDVIATGTPSGVAAGLQCSYLQPDDLVEAEVVGIGVLRNRLVQEDQL